MTHPRLFAQEEIPDVPDEYDYIAGALEVPEATRPLCAKVTHLNMRCTATLKQWQSSLGITEHTTLACVKDPTEVISTTGVPWLASWARIIKACDEEEMDPVWADVMKNILSEDLARGNTNACDLACNPPTGCYCGPRRYLDVSMHHAGLPDQSR